MSSYVFLNSRTNRSIYLIWIYSFSGKKTGWKTHSTYHYIYCILCISSSHFNKKKNTLMIFIMLQFEFLTLNVDAIIKWQHLHKTASPIKQWSLHLYMEILSIFSYSTFQQLFNDWFFIILCGSLLKFSRQFSITALMFDDCLVENN